MITFRGALLTFNSGKSIVIEVAVRGTGDLRASVTFTTQGADSSGGTTGAVFCPRFRISNADSSMRIGEEPEETRRG